MTHSWLQRVVLRAIVPFALIASILSIPLQDTAAHEVKPSIADIIVTDDERVSMTLRLNLESFIAGIDLDGLDDTNNSAQSDTYDSLRSLPPAELEQRFRAFWPKMRDRITISSASPAEPLALTKVLIPPIGNAELPRTSTIALETKAAQPIKVGWAKDYGRLILRQQGIPEDKAFTGMLSGGEMSPPISAQGGASEGAFDTFLRYIAVGFDHIIPKGLDHILFVLGLFFLTPKLGPLLWQVTAFTLAHTVTLALGALGWVTVSPSIVEPLIAASIVYVAVENIFTSGLHPWRPLLIFAFGLLHGLGFASVLGEFGLPDGQFVPALIGFNIGVEVGQIAVILIAFAIVGFWFRTKDWYRKAIAIPASLAIAAIGAYWVIERTLL